MFEASNVRLYLGFKWSVPAARLYTGSIIGNNTKEGQSTRCIHTENQRAFVYMIYNLQNIMTLVKVHQIQKIMELVMITGNDTEEGQSTFKHNVYILQDTEPHLFYDTGYSLGHRNL